MQSRDAGLKNWQDKEERELIISKLKILSITRHLFLSYIVVNQFTFYLETEKMVL